ncbi:DUF92 domain-containing protein [Paenibacillus polysaccharolyticus]|uniref:DUF92 domain-containing protein n=1 Tax=Paenibacillus polysaccharolyticus TaxID=582692 RepID=UPI00203F681E|nr:DUF92 domain-containing protein [Paenibacillus polysaccharolyticus]MCM3131689.1 DUF92 domain-containing protein [Paenibacillus polysaccharolyticus]
MDWIIGAVCASLVAGAAYAKKSLTLSGCLAAILMGTIYYGAGNLFWFGTLLLFFITSTLLSRFRKDRKQEMEKSYAKTGNRDAGQVMANGGIGMLLCLANWIMPHPSFLYAFIGVMATVTSDTWATEIGSLSRKPPRSVLTWKILTPGASGGVSVLGSSAAALGGIVIGAFAFVFASISGLEQTGWFGWTLIGLFGGLAGAFADSYLGATVQKMYRCTVCGREVEVHEHCGQPTIQARGWTWMSNDLVNVLSSVIGACIAIGLGSILAL